MKFLPLDFFSKNPIHPNSLISNFTNIFSRTNPESVPSTAQNFFCAVIILSFGLKISQPAFTCSKLTIETLEQGVKYVQS